MKRKFIIFCLIVLFIFTFFQNSSFAKVHSSAYRIVQDPAGVYVVEINTAKAKGRLIPYYSDELETNLDIYKKTNAKFAVNAGFFDPKNQKTVSYVVIDTLTVLDPKNNENLMKNKVLEPYFSKILNRTEFRILADSKGKLIYDIAPHDEAVKSGYTILHSIQAGPMLFPDLRLEEEFFVLVKDGKIIARGENRVVRKNDPTAHAEIIAIRQAASRLHTHDLTGCTMFSSSQPCPMCLAAIYWANMDAIYYAATCEDASSAGFRDEYLVYELKKEPENREKPEEHMVSLRQEAGEAFRIWKEDENRKEY